MKKILWALSVVLVMLIATGASADIRSDKCNAYSNDMGISSALDNYSGDICYLRGGYRTGSGTNGGGARTGRPSQPPADDGPPLGPIGPRDD